jgi:hypothetical protein
MAGVFPGLPLGFSLIMVMRKIRPSYSVMFVCWCW